MDRMGFFKTLPLNGRVVDLGCAAGNLHGLLRSRRRNVIGVDAAEPSDVVCDLNRRVPFENQTVDTLIAGEIIEHLENPLYFLKECRRVLRRGGRLILTTPNADSLLSFFAGLTNSYNKEHLFIFNRGSLSLLLKRSGFKTPGIFFLDASEEDGNCGKRPVWALPFGLFTALIPGLRFHLCMVAKK